jgi:uncharacterized protein (TIGR02147 family)
MKKNVFEYNDYRLFLKDFYLYKKGVAKGFTYRYFARRAGFISPVFIKLVIDGKSNLSAKSAVALVRAMELSDAEAFYFENLVKFNQAKTEQKKEKFFQILHNLNRVYGVQVLQSDQYEFYSNWYNSVLREIAPHRKNPKDYKEIGSLLIPRLGAHETEKAIELLKRIQVIVENPDGTFRQTAKNISTGSEVRSIAVRKYHVQMARLAAETIEVIPKEQRDISGLTIGVSKELIETVKERIRLFREEIMMLVSSDTQTVEQVYRLNLQLFPVSRNFSDTKNSDKEENSSQGELKGN